MKVFFERQFLKEVTEISRKSLRIAVEKTILNVENANSISEIVNFKKLKGSKEAYRIRVGDYRIGIYFFDNQIVFARILHRKEIYRYFPKK